MTETIPPSDFTEDSEIWPLLVRLRDCLCETLTERGLMPGDCFCGIVPGQQATWDYTSGMAWVRLDSVVPSAVFPGQSFDLNNCGTTLAADVEVGVLHCTPVQNADGSPPDQLQQFGAARLQMATMAAIRAAILCCADGSDLDLILGSYDPQGPNGGLVGGAWTVSVGRA
jgi:hypothetical protein